MIGALAGAGIAEAADRGVDEPGVALGEPLVADAEAVHHAGAEVLDQHVGAVDQATEHLEALLLLEVDHHAALAAVDALEVAAVGAVPAGLGRERGHLARAVAAGRLDLHHVGALVGEQHRAERPGEHLRQIDDPEALERAAHVPPSPLAQWLLRLTSTSRSPSKTTASSWLTPQCLKRTTPASSRSAARVSSTRV